MRVTLALGFQGIFSMVELGRGSPLNAKQCFGQNVRIATSVQVSPPDTVRRFRITLLFGSSFDFVSLLTIPFKPS